MSNERFALGFMTGTSLDGIDAAAIRGLGRGDDLDVEVVRHVHRPWPDDLEGLRAFAHGEPRTASEIGRLAHDFGRLHAAVVRDAFDDLAFDLVAVHGQTVHHAPPLSWQLIDPWPILEACRCPVVSDLRSADLIAGGEGAPITPRADAILFRRQLLSDSTVAIVNLGGFANVTLLPSADPASAIGFDCCPCNHMLDAASRHGLGRPYDEDGRVTAAGTPEPNLQAALMPRLASILDDARSGGDGDDAIEVVRSLAEDARAHDHVPNLLASLACVVATVVLKGIHAKIETHRLPKLGRVLLAGGGVRNSGLVQAFRDPVTTEQPDLQVESTDAVDVPAEAREAVDMAILGLLAMDGLDITTPGTTGRDDAMPPSGSWIGPRRS